MIKVNDKKTAIVGGVVGIVILLTIFCCEGPKEAVEAAPVEAVEEVIEATPAVEEVIEAVTPEVEEVEETPAVEEVTPAETVE